MPAPAEKWLTYSRIGYLPSWHCDARCRHCFIPFERRRRDRFQADVLRAITAHLPAGIKHVSISGGEPFLHPQRLRNILSAFGALGIAGSVVTNGRWLAGNSGRVRTLTRLQQRGLEEVAVSIDEHHRPSLTIRDLSRVVDAVMCAGLSITIKAVGLRPKRQIAVFLAEDPRAKLVRLERIALENTGDAAGLVQERYPGGDFGYCQGPLIPSVTPRGRVFACCSSRLFELEDTTLHLGNLNEEPLDVLLSRAACSPLIALIAAHGPVGASSLLGALPAGTRPDLTPCAHCRALVSSPSAEGSAQALLSTSRQLRQDTLARLLLLEQMT